MKKNIDKKQIRELIDNFQALKKQDKMDLSTDEDLSLAIMNLVSIEEHFFFTAEKTGKEKYYDLLAGVREIRKSLLKKLVKNPKGEVWCISKHLLAASMRLMEVGTKELGRGHKKEAYGLFEKAYELYSLFWGVNLKAIPIDNLKQIDDKTLNIRDKSKNGIFAKFKELVQKIVDCCIE